MDSADRVFGWIAVQKGFISPQRMEQAHEARIPEAGTLPFADWLVVRGWLTREQKDEILETLKRASAAHTVAESDSSTGGPGADPTVPQTEAGAPPLHIGRLGKYELLEEIGRGGMGVVYRALDTELRREVALKTVLLGDTVRKEAVDRLLREARTAAGLDHPGIVPIHDMGVIDGIPYFAMTFVRGRRLDRLLREGGISGMRERARIVRDIAQAVAHAHSRKIIHRDLKPANVLVDEAGRVHVMDFGLAKRLDEGAKITATGQMLGTPHYMPPEQINGDSALIGPPSDVYALGAVLYEALTGRPPYEGASVAEIVGKALQSDPESPRRRDRRIHVDLETICLKALDKEPGRRYADAGELAVDLDRYLRGEAIDARPITWGSRVARRVARQKALAAFATLAVCIGLWAAVTAVERLELHQKVREDLRQKAGLYLDTALTLRREGLSPRRARADYLPKLIDAVTEADRLDPGRADPHYHLGRFYRALMEFTLALREQETALSRDPSYSDAVYEHAVLTAQMHGRRIEALRDRALQQLGSRMAQGGTAAHEKIALPGDEELEKADEEARGLRERLLADLAVLERPGLTRLAPARLVCAQGLAFAYGPAGEPQRERARTLLAQAIEAAPSLEEAYEGLARVELGAGRWEEAAAVYERGLDTDKGYIPFWLGRATARNAAGAAAMRRGVDPRTFFSGALADFAKARDLDPESVEASNGRGSAGLNWGLYKTSRGEDPAPLYAGATADYDKAVQLAPAGAEAWMGRGLVRVNWGWYLAGIGTSPEEHYRSAEADFGKAIECDPQEWRAWAFRGLARADWIHHAMEHGLDPSAIAAGGISDLTRAIELNPASYETWMRRGMVRANWAWDVCERGGDAGEHFALGLADFDKALEIHPGFAESWMWRGMLCYNWSIHLRQSGQDGAAKLAAAEESQGKAIDLNPAMAEAWMRRGMARCEMATDDLRGGRSPEAHFRAAGADLERALELNPTLARALFNRAMLKMALGGWKISRGEDPRAIFPETMADLDQTVEVKPDYADAWRVRGVLRSLFAEDQRRKGVDVAGLVAAAFADLDRAIALDGRDAAGYLARGQLHATGAQWKEACEDFDRARSLRRTLDPEALEMGAWAHGMRAAELAGNAPDEAFAHLERALEWGWRDLAQLAAMPGLEPLMKDPRWAKLLEKAR